MIEDKKLRVRLQDFSLIILWEFLYFWVGKERGEYHWSNVDWWRFCRVLYNVYPYPMIALNQHIERQRIQRPSQTYCPLLPIWRYIVANSCCFLFAINLPQIKTLHNSWLCVPGKICFDKLQRKCNCECEEKRFKCWYYYRQQNLIGEILETEEWWIFCTASKDQKYLSPPFCSTRSCAALRVADLDWIVGQEYLEVSQCNVALCVSGAKLELESIL